MGPLTYQIELPTQWRVHDVFHRSKLHPVPDDVINGRENPIGPRVVAMDRQVDLARDINQGPPPQEATTSQPQQQQLRRQH